MKSEDDVSRLMCYLGFLLMGSVWMWTLADKLDKIVHLLGASR